MKKTMKRMMSLLIAALLALSMAALSEEFPEELEAPEIEVQLGDEPEEGETLMSEEAPADATVTWCFIVGDELYATQEAREGEAILRPEDPVAPEGMVFAGWALEDGAALFVDADGDGEVDPVIAHVDALITEVNALAVFEAAQEGLVEEAEAQEPSPLGKGGTEQSDVTEEVAAPDDVNNEDEGEEETTSSVSPDGEPAFPKGEALEAEEPSVEENTEDTQEPSVEDEGADEAAPALPMANALTYTGEAQALVSAAGVWLYSLDGESYSEAIPTGINAGEYIVYFKAAGDAEPQTLLVTIAKADVVFIAPVAAATGD